WEWLRRADRIAPGGQLAEVRAQIKSFRTAAGGGPPRGGGPRRLPARSQARSRGSRQKKTLSAGEVRAMTRFPESPAPHAIILICTWLLKVWKVSSPMNRAAAKWMEPTGG